MIDSTFLGGKGTDVGRSIALNKSGDAYITGSTDSTDFPVTNAFNTTASGGQDAFVAWISSVRPDRGLQFFG
ncbi:MAG: SBBP repeat-containing protein [Candidatus Aminicenantales bacterium]